MTRQNRGAVAAAGHSSSDADLQRDEMETDGMSGGIKLQKACIHCRRSKVKCVHEGKPPCRRCKDANQECKFRLRAVSRSSINVLSMPLNSLLIR